MCRPIPGGYLLIGNENYTKLLFGKFILKELYTRVHAHVILHTVQRVLYAPMQCKINTTRRTWYVLMCCKSNFEALIRFVRCNQVNLIKISIWLIVCLFYYRYQPYKNYIFRNDINELNLNLPTIWTWKQVLISRMISRGTSCRGRSLSHVNQFERQQGRRGERGK